MSDLVAYRAGRAAGLREAAGQIMAAMSRFPLGYYGNDWKALADLESWCRTRAAALEQPAQREDEG